MSDTNTTETIPERPRYCEFAGVPYCWVCLRCGYETRDRAIPSRPCTGVRTTGLVRK